MKKLFLIIFILISNCVFSQWIVQYKHPGNVRFEDVNFLNTNTGFACGSDGIYKTTNKGSIWLPIFESPGGFKEIEVKSNNIAYALSGKLYKTFNGGLNWVELNKPSGSVIKVIEFIDEYTGFIGGEMGYLYKTTDGGITWTDPGTFIDNCITMQFVTPNYGIVSEEFGYPENGKPDPYFLYITNDTGNSWVRYSLSFIFWPIHSISFVNQDLGYITEGNFLWKTIDGCKNFQKVFSYYSFVFNDVFATSEDTVYVVGFLGQIAKTTNGGLNWNLQKTGIFSSLHSVYFLNNNTGYAVGDSGRILYTTNGGEVGIKKISGIIPEKYTLNQNYPNPFNSSTIIDFTLPLKSKVKLFVYDILGKEVAVPVDEELNPGHYSVDFDANNLTSGIYFYRLQTTNYSEIKRMIILK